MISQGLHYKDIALVPKFSTLETRAHANTMVEFCGHSFNLPIVPANMATTIDMQKAEYLAAHNYFYILHRFFNYSEVFNWIKNMNTKRLLVSISIGVHEKDYRLLHSILEANLQVHFITIDIAHGFCHALELMATFVKLKFPKTKLIVGNFFGDRDSLNFCYNLHADAVKIGLSYGAACTTYDKTGFASPMFSCGVNAHSFIGLHSNPMSRMQLIGDGGIRSHGDIAKALRAGYSMVMAGGLFAACIDSPAPLVCGKKLYYGSASAKNKGHSKHVEGREILLECNGLTYEQKLNEITQDLQSAISYAGGHDISALRNVEVITI